MMKIFSKKIKLSVFERIIILEMLDRVDFDFIVKNAILEIEKKISFSSKELQRLKIKSKDGEVFWMTEFDKQKKIYLDDFSRSIIKKCLVGLGKAFSSEYKELIEKFS